VEDTTLRFHHANWSAGDMQPIDRGPSPRPAVQIAASIEYDFTARPSGLAEDFKPIGETFLKFIRIKTIDGYAMEAALWLPAKKEAAETTLVVMIHGSGGSYRRAPESALGPRLAANGHAALAINTRQHDDKVNTDNFLEVRRDIEAAVQVGRALGYERLVLQGHSLGAIQVQFFAATNWDPDIKAVILLGAFGNLPWKSRNLLVQDEARFRALIEASMKSLREGSLDQVLPIKMRFSNPVSSTTASAGPDIPITGQHFLTYRWDKTSVADGTFWIQRIPRPILIVRDQSDGVVQPFEPHMLLSAAQSEGSLVTSIEFVLLPDAKPVSLSGHYFAGNEQPLTELIAKWLVDQHL
jgi:pimeloyl-ACP methyl ester carboxylesterase